MQAVLNVATFNVRRDLWFGRIAPWKERREFAAQALRDMDAQAVGMQELLPKMRANMESLLPEFAFFGEGRGKNKQGEHTDVALKTRDFYTLFSETYDADPQNLLPRSRIFTVCEAVFLPWGEPLRLCNTHLSWLSEKARLRSVDVILSALDRRQQQRPMPTILMGDFNATPDSRPIERVMRESVLRAPVKLQDAFQKPTRMHTFHGEKARPTWRTLDYIFVSPEFEVLDVRTYETTFGGRFPSDHFPLMAALVLKNNR